MKEFKIIIVLAYCLLWWHLANAHGTCHILRRIPCSTPSKWSFNNQPCYFNTHEEVKIYEIGCNTTTPEVHLHIQPVSDIQLLDINFFKGAI